MELRSLSILVLAFALFGCSGTMHGVVRGSGQAVTVNYEQGMSSDTYTLTMPDGEIFKGKAVLADRSSGIGNSFGSAYAFGSSGSFAQGFGSSTNFFSSSTGKVVATLFGNRGHTMRCLMQYANASGETSGGGVGQCQINDGRELDIQW